MWCRALILPWCQTIQQRSPRRRMPALPWLAGVAPSSRPPVRPADWHASAEPVVASRQGLLSSQTALQSLWHPHKGVVQLGRVDLSV